MVKLQALLVIRMSVDPFVTLYFDHTTSPVQVFEWVKGEEFFLPFTTSGRLQFH